MSLARNAAETCSNQDGTHPDLTGGDYRIDDILATFNFVFDKLDQQYRISNDDPGQGNKSDHGSRRELGTDDQMSGNYTY